MTGKILQGIRVIDFAVVWAGPYASRMLSEMGAEVIHVEHPKLLGQPGTSRMGEPAKMAKALGMEVKDLNEDSVASESKATWLGVRDTYFAAFNATKKSITLDTTKPAGRETLNELIKICDVSIENLTPDVAQKIGISYEQLKQVNPRIIGCAVRGFGEGPWANHVAYGNTMEYLSGITSMTGYGYEEGSRPMPAGVFTVDPIGAMQAVAAIISALMYRKRTGEGMRIEVSQYEAAASFTNEALIDYTMNKRVRTPIGNNDKDIAFQGCYPAKGNDQWIVLSVRNQKEWANLCGLLHKEDWLTDGRFSQPSKLEANRREVDMAISAWTIQRNKKDATQFLQSLNIPSAPINNIVETIFDQQLRHRECYKWIEYPFGATAPTPRMPVKFTKTPLPEVYEPAKAPNADNYYVYGQLLGFSESHIKELEANKII